MMTQNLFIKKIKEKIKKFYDILVLKKALIIYLVNKE